MHTNIVGDEGKEGPPVPMPNTEVKLFSVDDTWRVTARESRTLPTQKAKHIERYASHIFLNSSVGRACGC